MAAINGKGDRILLASAVRTATNIPPAALQVRDPDALGIRVYLNITAASGTGGLKVLILAYDPLTKNSTPLSAGGTAVTATGLYLYALYPGIQTTLSGNNQDRISDALPITYSVQVTHGDASNYTYSLACELLQ